jgi:hypothetical protein
VSLNAILDDADGRLVCLYTEPGAEWVLPCCTESAETIEWITETVGWSLSETPDARVEGSFPEILGAVWGKVGVHPGLAGQIVVRPRRVEFVGRGPHPEEWRNRPLWLIEVRGAMTRWRHGVYKSGLIGLMNPGNPDDWSVVHLN